MRVVNGPNLFRLMHGSGLSNGFRFGTRMLPFRSLNCFEKKTLLFTDDTVVTGFGIKGGSTLCVETCSVCGESVTKMSAECYFDIPNKLKMPGYVQSSMPVLGNCFVWDSSVFDDDRFSGTYRQIDVASNPSTSTDKIRRFHVSFLISSPKYSFSKGDVCSASQCANCGSFCRILFDDDYSGFAANVFNLFVLCDENGRLFPPMIVPDEGANNLQDEFKELYTRVLRWDAMGPMQHSSIIRRDTHGEFKDYYSVWIDWIWDCKALGCLFDEHGVMIEKVPSFEQTSIE